MCNMCVMAGPVALLLLLATGLRAERTEVGPAICHPDCTKFGNCGEDGHCKCPFGRIGEACEIDFLAPCRQSPEGEAHCGIVSSKSCECWRRCREYFCVQTDVGKRCHEFDHDLRRACFHREGVPPEQQYSNFPEPTETNVKCFEGYPEGSKEANCSEVGFFNNDITHPLSLCPKQCSKRGFCMSLKEATHLGPVCRCDRGYYGEGCDSKQQANICYKQCSGRGTCRDQFCHCKPPYFSIGCTRSKVYPANYSQPSPVNFKIYMYELSTRWAYDNVRMPGWSPGQNHDPIYIAYQKFLDRFLDSPLRTEDPSAANMFFIPAMNYAYSGNVGIANDHLNAVIHHVKHAHPYWNRTGGRDHFFWMTNDRGACHLSGDPLNAVKIVHFGSTATPDNHGTMPPWGHRSYGCAHPLRDVVAVPHQPNDFGFLEGTLKLTLEELLAKKNRMFFFAGGVRHPDPEYSGLARQTLHNLTREWNDTDFQFIEGGAPDYVNDLRASKFCLAAYGHGWGNRLLQSMLAGCVPVIVQDHVMQYFEDVLPYEDFSIRLNNDDLPKMREILRSITKEEYRRLLENVLLYHKAFLWNEEKGGQAFEYTVLSLRRKHLHYKARYYGRYSHLEQENCQPWGTPDACKPSTATS